MRFRPFFLTTYALLLRPLRAAKMSSSSSSSSAPIAMREARVSDLPYIHELIRGSFAAMQDHTDPVFWKRWEDGAQSSIDNGDLKEEAFVAEYLNPKRGAGFWVADHSELGVLGCVGLKRNGKDDGELVRMAVSPTYRGGRIGQRLVEHLVDFCKQERIMRVHLVTANPEAARFYKEKCSFCTSLASEFKMQNEDKSVESTLAVFRMVRFLSERVIRSVAIVGGTHGNERIGVELVKQWQGEAAEAVTRSTFKTTVLLGNPQAVARNVRYIDADLNRQFIASKGGEEASGGGGGKSAEKVEEIRARELQEILGKKSADFKSSDEAEVEEEGGGGGGGVDFTIDLHSSNSHTGLVAMIAAGDNDVNALRVCSHLVSTLAQQQLQLRVTMTEGKKDASWCVDSCSTSGVAFEVGPLAHGTLSSELVEQTRSLVLLTLDCIEQQNLLLLSSSSSSSSSFVSIVPAGVLDVRGIERVFPALDVHVGKHTVEYPESGLCVHPSLEGPNWKEIKEGDAAFISLDGTKRVVPLSLPPPPAHTTGPPPGPPSSLFTLFVNEAAYQERNAAFALYEKKSKIVV